MTWIATKTIEQPVTFLEFHRSSNDTVDAVSSCYHPPICIKLYFSVLTRFIVKDARRVRGCPVSLLPISGN